MEAGAPGQVGDAVVGSRVSSRDHRIVPDEPVIRLSGVGKRRAQALAKLGVQTVGDLIELWPRRHLNRCQITPVGELALGQECLVVGRIQQAIFKRTPSRREVLRVVVDDGSGRLAVTFFHARWLTPKLPVGQRVAVSGPVERYGGWLSMSHPDLELLDADQSPRLGLIPVYPLVAGISQRWLSDLMYRVLPELIPDVSDPLPEWLRSEHGLRDRPCALLHEHFPSDEAELEDARRRLAFDEFLRIGLAVHWMSEPQRSSPSVRVMPDGPLSRKFLARLPFALTRGQQAAWEEISADLVSARPMARLLQGDVGSGKTIVAALTLLAAVDGGRQAAFMAPTELLAEQHYQVLAPLLEPLGVRLHLLTGRTPGRRPALEAMRGHRLHVVVGTQALVSEQVQFADLGVVVVDEQHRFGVRQRAGLSDKGNGPHVLVMTATPIPRTMALTVFGDLEISRIEGMPPGRSPVTTMQLRKAERRLAYQAVADAVRSGRQAYVVCSLIHQNSDLGLKGAVELAEGMRAAASWKVGLLHGQLPAEEKNGVMQAFRDHRLDVLVTTNIIEVGVDVPNATVMVVENAERFGIAQLHQLRGRVGRGEHPAVCFLLANDETDEAEQRLAALVEHHDGLDLAERDLALRGPGEVLGLRQHGLRGFRLARPLGDLALLEEARAAAREVLARDPGLVWPEHAALKAWMLTAIEEQTAQRILT